MKPTVAETKEYRRILATLDHEQHLNLAAHLYSAFLIKRDQPFDGPAESARRVVPSRIPHKLWTAWPTPDASPPPFIDDTMPDPEPELVTAESVAERAAAARETFPQFETDPDTVLLHACETYLRRLVYDRIHAETRADLEPVVEPEPAVDDVWPAALTAVVDKYLALPPLRGARPGSIDFRRLGIRGAAKDRLDALFGESDA